MTPHDMTKMNQLLAEQAAAWRRMLMIGMACAVMFGFAVGTLVERWLV